MAGRGIFPLITKLNYTCDSELPYMGYDFLGDYYFGYVFLTGGRGANRIRLRKIYQPHAIIKFPDTPWIYL